MVISDFHSARRLGAVLAASLLAAGTASAQTELLDFGPIVPTTVTTSARPGGGFPSSTSIVPLDSAVDSVLAGRDLGRPENRDPGQRSGPAPGVGADLIPGYQRDEIDPKKSGRNILAAHATIDPSSVAEAKALQKHWRDLLKKFPGREREIEPILERIGDYLIDNEDGGKGGKGKKVGGKLGSRTNESGTEGVIGGGDRFGDTGKRGKRGKRGKSDRRAHPSKGRVKETPVNNDDRTRWETVKAVIRDFFRAYVNQDLGAMMRLLSPDFLQDSSILRNAILDDFQNETNINIDVELLTYRISFDSVVVEMRWFRTSTNQEQNGSTGVGEAIIEQGDFRIIFDRLNKLLIKVMQGDTPFGRRDAQWAEQERAGQKAGSSAGSGSSGPQIRSQTVTGIDGTTPSGANHFPLNLEGTTLGAGTDQTTCGTGCTTGNPDDVVISITHAGPSTINFFIPKSTSTFVNPGGGDATPPAVKGCVNGSSNTLENYKGIDVGSLSQNFFSENVAGAYVTGQTRRRVIGVQTAEGNYGLVEVTVTITQDSPGKIHTMQVRWVVFSSSSSGFANGTDDC